MRNVALVAALLATAHARFSRSNGKNAFTVTTLASNEASQFPFSFPFKTSESKIQPAAPAPVDSRQYQIDTADMVNAVATLISTVTMCYITVKLGREVQKLIRGAVDMLGQSSNATRLSVELQSLLKPNTTLTSYELEMSSSVVLPSAIDMDFKSIGGLADIKRSLIEAAEDSGSSYNISDKLLKPVRGVLLYGPPGCGKTSLVQAMCKRLQRPFLQITPSSLLRKYVGETSQLLRATFSLACKLEPCVIFIDEMDSLLRSRRDGEQEFDRNLKTEFMQLWDSLLQSPSRVIIVGATNRPQDLDSAIQRRFERSFLVGPPDKSSRKQIFKAVLKDAPTGEFDFDAAAGMTQDYTPSDIVALCRAALQSLIREHKRNAVFNATNGADKLRSLSVRDVEQAMSTVFPTAWVAKTYGEVSQSTTQSGWSGGSSDLYGPDDEDEDDD